MRHAGRSVIVSGSTVAVGLLSMILLPLPFIRSIGIGGMLIPAVSVLTAITLLPALLYTLGPRINSVRVLPRRLVEGSDDPERASGTSGRTSSSAGPIPVAAVGLAIVAVLLFYGVQLNPGDAQVKDFPGGGPAHIGARCSARPGSPTVSTSRSRSSSREISRRRSSTRWRRSSMRTRGSRVPRAAAARADGLALVEAYLHGDGSSRDTGRRSSG